ncbi:uncharacterized protein [Nicotiana sylvestris]|uniref:uncharacterized protein n=1 Tax=Nicotiana sylvestris TaxID=4096 RepID=UPI00388C655B
MDIVTDYIFAYNVASSIMQESEDLEPQSVGECRQRLDWPKLQEAIQLELSSLAKREVFGPVVQTPNGVKPVGYKWKTTSEFVVLAVYVDDINLIGTHTELQKVLKRFYMDGAHPLSTPMIVRSLDVNKDPFRPQKKNEELLGPEVPYLSAIGALIKMEKNAREDIKRKKIIERQLGPEGGKGKS